MQSRRKPEISPVEQIQAAFQNLTAELVSKQMEGMLAMRSSLDQANQILNDRLSESSRSLDKRVEVFGEIKSQIGELSVQAKNIENIGLNIQSLSDLLKPPKLRGTVGETFLENIPIRTFQFPFNWFIFYLIFSGRNDYRKMVT